MLWPDSYPSLWKRMRPSILSDSDGDTLIDVIVLRRGKESKETGVGAYSDVVGSVLQSSSLSHGEIRFKLTTEDGHAECLKYGFIEPLLYIINSRSRIYHATEELCCLFLPFVRGKKVVTFHHVSDSREGRSRLLYPIWKMAAKIAVSHSDMIIAISQQTKEDLIRTYGIDEKKIRVMMHGPAPEFRNLKRSREKTIGFVGTLIERKNIIGGLRAFKLFTEMPGTEGYRFVICGDGPLRGELESAAAELGISERIEFIPRMTKDELIEFYNRISVFANSSMHEGLGMTALEAQACGAPVVFFRDARIPEEVTVNFIPSIDEKDFAENMLRLIKDEEFRNSHLKSVEERSLEKEYPKALLNMYSDLLED